MTRPTGHAASRPFRLTRAAVDAHREHYPTPFLGLPDLRPSHRDDADPDPLDLAPPGLTRPTDTPTIGQLASASVSIRGGCAASHALSSASFDRR